jgi:hypothetical protein
MMVVFGTMLAATELFVPNVDPDTSDALLLQARDH